MKASSDKFCCWYEFTESENCAMSSLAITHVAGVTSSEILCLKS